MVVDAERARKEDNSVKHKINSHNKLEHYCFIMKNYLSDKKLAEKFSADDVETIGEMTKDVVSWLGASDPETSEMEQKQAELEERFKPIMNRVLGSIASAADDSAAELPTN